MRIVDVVRRQDNRCETCARQTDAYAIIYADGFGRTASWVFELPCGHEYQPATFPGPHPEGSLTQEEVAAALLLGEE